MSAALPLLAPRDLDAPLAWCAGVPVSAAQFISEAQWLAERLPPGARPVNLVAEGDADAPRLEAAISNSFAFGGTNSVLLFRRG